MLDIYGLASEFNSLDVNKIKLEELTEEQIESLHSLVSKKQEFKRQNKLAYWMPYPFQLEWIEASNKYQQRYLSAANRVGKSYAACMELAIHITGLYPSKDNGALFDWQGMKIDSGGHDFWCIGVSQESVNNVLMKELLGVSDCRNLQDLGTGAIPKDCIDSWSMVKDGARCLKIRIKHVDGTTNTLHFFAATQNESVLMGASVKYCLLDEQFQNETEIYAQCLTRTATTNGYISVTATPELGASALWTKFNEDDSGFLYFQNATWDHCPHLSEQDKARLLAGYPEYQRLMRSAGIPVLGAGAVYPFNDNEIDTSLTVERIKQNPYAYKLLWGCDFGFSSNTDADPSTLVLSAYEMETDTIYIVYEWNSKQDAKKNRLAHMPDHMASVIKASPFPDAPLVVPHDAKKQIDGTGTNTTRLSEFKRLGVNVLPTVFEIPFQLTTGAIEKPKHSRSLHWTIQHLCKLFSENKLKINVNKLKELMSEFRIYQYKKDGNPRDSRNHLLDAMRIASISVKYKGINASQCVGGKLQSRWETGRKVNEAFNRHF
ncbi:terminase family protein [Klebsiella aerogenes]|nr:terminase family protein [Klebsiella aerogenes]